VRAYLNLACEDEAFPQQLGVAQELVLMRVQVCRQNLLKKIKKVGFAREQDHLQEIETDLDLDLERRNEVGVKIDTVADIDIDQLHVLTTRETASEEENAGENDVVAKKRKRLAAMMQSMMWWTRARQDISMKTDLGPLRLPNPNAQAIEAVETGTNIERGRRPVIESTNLLRINTAPAIGLIVMIDLEAVIETTTATATENIAIATAVAARKNSKSRPRR
jgi:hypothetical protein